MNGIQRRREILDTLRTAKGPLSGTSLAETFSVSRQVIVQDMALIRAEGTRYHFHQPGISYPGAGTGIQDRKGTAYQ